MPMSTAVTRFITSLHSGVSDRHRWLLAANVTTVVNPMHSATLVRYTSRRLTSKRSASSRPMASADIPPTVRKGGAEWEAFGVPRDANPRQGLGSSRVQGEFGGRSSGEADACERVSPFTSPGGGARRGWGGGVRAAPEVGRGDREPRASSGDARTPGGHPGPARG